MSSYPSLVTEYVEFVNYKSEFENSGKIDLSDTSFVFPTTFLPLSEIIVKNRENYIPPKSTNVANYITTMIDLPPSNLQHTYTPIVTLPESCEEVEGYLKEIFAMQKNTSDFGGISAFKYVVSELIDNIYEHSNFTKALIMGQRYDSKGFIDLSFYDNGITIPQSFKEKKLPDEASNAIREALNGMSTKDNDRGFGLRTSLNLFIKGLNSKFFIVSGNGAVHVDRNGDELYRLTESAGLNGTLISVRIPKNTPKINIYDYVE